MTTNTTCSNKPIGLGQNPSSLNMNWLPWPFLQMENSFTQCHKINLSTTS